MLGEKCKGLLAALASALERDLNFAMMCSVQASALMKQPSKPREAGRL